MSIRYMTPEEQNMPTERCEVQCRVHMNASSIIGTRKYQQDSFACIEIESGSMAVVCDGMGGLNGGEQASQLSVEQLMNDFIRAMPMNNIIQFYYDEAKKLDRMVYLLKDDKGNKLGAGTTIVSVIIKDKMLNWLSVGDSKIYVIRDGRLYCIVSEHNYRLTLDNLLQKGKITIDEYKKEEYRAEALISFLGIGNVSLIETNTAPFELVAGDIILLCSDGLYKSLSDEQILSVIKDNSFDYQKAADTLTASALRCANGAQDNTTVVILSYN